jgi:quinol monooxygenase YgiN
VVNSKVIAHEPSEVFGARPRIVAVEETVWCSASGKRETTMSEIRVLISAAIDEEDVDLVRLEDQARTMRGEEGCVHFEIFRSVEFPENFVQIETWENIEKLETRLRSGKPLTLLGGESALEAPFHGGTVSNPRRHGLNGIEFYPLQRYKRIENEFVRTEMQSAPPALCWPSRFEAVRVLINESAEPSHDAEMVPYSLDTRSQPGCVEFDFMRSLDFLENRLHIELWIGPPSLYDAHYQTRNRQRAYGGGIERPPDRPLPRRIGAPGLEFYQHCFYARVGETFQPEETDERMSTVHW